jgi:hypothetical protein
VQKDFSTAGGGMVGNVLFGYSLMSMNAISYYLLPYFIESIARFAPRLATLGGRRAACPLTGQSACLCRNDRLTQDQRGFGAAPVRKISDKGRRYRTLDDERTLLSAREDPVGMIRSLDRAVIDEIQRNDAAGGWHLGCTALDLVGNVEETQRAQQSQITLRDWCAECVCAGWRKAGAYP